jgi:hypothetical protein
VNVQMPASPTMLIVPVNPLSEYVALTVKTSPPLVVEQVSVDPLHEHPVVPPSFG